MGNRKDRFVLILLNIILLMVSITASLVYSNNIRKNQLKMRQEDFITTVESMKQVSQNYLNSEQGYVDNWAAYITSQDMTLRQALNFLRFINTNRERFAHIVDMETFEAYSSYYPEGEEKIDTYLYYNEEHITDVEQPFLDKMMTIFEGRQHDFDVLGKYTIQETMTGAVAIGHKVTLITENGRKDYLLLRVIPTSALKKSWSFPVEYSSAEVGIITRKGEYVIQSPSMKSSNFPEYIRGYNFQHEYNKVYELRDQLVNTERGNWIYKNYRDEECMWYFSSFGSDSSLDILGVINMDELKDVNTAWFIVILICGTLTLMFVIDGIYLNSINKQLRTAAETARQANEAKTQFLSAMSHDIRTPMNAVLGMMTIAKNNTDNAAYVDECLNKSIASARQLLTLINDILDISKIESGKVVLNQENVSLNEIIDSLLGMLSNNMQQKNINLTTDFERLPYKYVRVDSMRLNQIYVNLLSNAIKYTRDGGKIELSLYEEKPENGKPAYTRLVFVVSDNGIGMSADFQKNMYNSFSRAITTQVNRTQGSGLGLAIVKQMVDIMEGTIECKSAPDQGTTFKVSLDLPIVNEVSCTNENEDMDGEDIRTLHLLIAEDNDLNWEIISTILNEQGVTCERAENGQLCIDKLQESQAQEYDAILMDVQMPVMNGIQATEAIRNLSDPEKCSIPIIAMTADAFAEDMQNCMNAGMNGHISKPIDMRKLMEYLRKIKNGKF